MYSEIFHKQIASLTTEGKIERFSWNAFIMRTKYTMFSYKFSLLRAIYDS